MRGAHPATGNTRWNETRKRLEDFGKSKRPLDGLAVTYIGCPIEKNRRKGRNYRPGNEVGQHVLDARTSNWSSGVHFGHAAVARRRTFP